MSRLDLVTEKVFNDILLFSSNHIISCSHQLYHYKGGLNPIPLTPTNNPAIAHSAVSKHSTEPVATSAPNPFYQSMKVLAPVPARKQMLKAIHSYYHTLLANHLTQGKCCFCRHTTITFCISSQLIDNLQYICIMFVGRSL